MAQKSRCGLSQNHKIIWFKRPLRSSSPASNPSPQYHQAMSFSATSPHFLNISRDGDPTTSPSSLCQYLTTPSEKKFVLITNLSQLGATWIYSNESTGHNYLAAWYCWAGSMFLRNTEWSPAGECSTKKHSKDILRSTMAFSKKNSRQPQPNPKQRKPQERKQKWRGERSLWNFGRAGEEQPSWRHCRPCRNPACYLLIAPQQTCGLAVMKLSVGARDLVGESKTTFLFPKMGVFLWT